VQDIEVLQAQLAQSRAQLLELVAQIEARPADMDCAANARRVLAQMRLDDAPARALDLSAQQLRPLLSRRPGRLRVLAGHQSPIATTLETKGSSALSQSAPRRCISCSAL
jgi:hypothetical protein